MCCFSGPVDHVNATRIFARRAGSRQHLVYAMSFSARSELAMILPIPVKPGSGERAVEFVDLSGYPDFFEDLEKNFARSGEELLSLDADPMGAVLGLDLEVHDVGAFEASYVPSLADFARLDRRFRLPEGIVRGPFGQKYARHGFAVFKLKPGDEVEVHPMAFVFPSALPATDVFFPTVHVHDGERMPERALFDHALYVQGGRPVPGPSPVHWQRSTRHLGTTVDADKARGVVDPDDEGWKVELRGVYSNSDFVLEVANDG